MASLTSFATFRRSEGSTSSASAPNSLWVLEMGWLEGPGADACAHDSLGTINKAIARSRSILNWTSKGA